MNEIEKALEQLRDRLLPDGGFSGQSGSAYRPDATAWGLLAWHFANKNPDEVKAARVRLCQSQQSDGRVVIDPGYQNAYWPTTDAFLAWHGDSNSRSASDRALHFILNSGGKTYRVRKNSAVGHDPSIKGWAWIENTHSWVEPTAMGLLALELAGQSEHPRAKEGRRLLINRQLESGGWNYGNTKTYCVELKPSMESTGLALHALANHVEKTEVTLSLDYLTSNATSVRGPLWVGWTILALSAWGQRPKEATAWIQNSLAGQENYGPYDTAWLGVLLCAAHCPNGLTRALTN